MVAEVRMDDATFSCEDSCVYANDGECDEDQVCPSPSEIDGLSGYCVEGIVSSACNSISSAEFDLHIANNLENALSICTAGFFFFAAAAAFIFFLVQLFCCLLSLLFSSL